MKQSPKWLYEEVNCQRDDIENRIKELKALDVDRTSCTSLWANQLRVLMAAAAYVLMQEIRLNAELTTLARAQVWTLRERLLKLGARLVGSVRRICQNRSRGEATSSASPLHWAQPPDRPLAEAFKSELHAQRLPTCRA
jgi:hypothetical protein